MNTNLRKDIKTKNDVAKMLVKAATLMEIVEDYTAAYQMKGDDTNAEDDVFLNRSKTRLAQYKKQLKESGLEVETVDDVINALNVSEEGAILQSLIQRSIPEEQRSTLSMEDYVHTYMGLLRERELLEFDFLMQDMLLKEFEQNPKDQISKWDGRLKSDKQLEAILEEDYVNSIREYESAAAREVKDGDIYVGNDGYWYITKKVGDRFEKHRYHPNSRKIDPQALQFNPIEYDQAKKGEEEALQKKSAYKKANDNIQNGTTSTSEQPVSEPSTEETAQPEPVVEPAVNNEIKEGDFVNTGTGVAQVLGTDGEGNFVLSYGAGQPEVVHADPQSLTKVTSPIEQAKYSTGEIIKASNGDTYTVGNVYLESIDKDTYEPTYSYDLVNIDTGETLPSQTANQINKMTAVAVESNTGSTVEPNDKQNEIKQQLKEKLESDKKNTELSNGTKRRTGHDYFIKIK